MGNLARLPLSIRRPEIAALGAILLVGLAARVWLMSAPVHVADLTWFRQWAAHLLAMPLWEFYSRGAPDCDYLPGYLYILALTARLADLVGSPIDTPQAFGFWVKPLPVAADLALGVVAYHLTHRIAGPRRAVAAAGLIVLNPALPIVSAAWGQVDSVGALLSTLSLAALVAGNPVAAAVWAAMAFTVKPQYTPFLVVAGVAYVRRDLVALRGLKAYPPAALWARWVAYRVLVPVVVLVATLQVLLLPFSVSLWPTAGATWTLYDRMMVSANWYPVTSINAFNLWGTAVAGWGLPDSTPAWLSLSYQTWGILLLAAVLAPVALLAWVRAQDPGVVLWGCFVASFATFVLLTRMHDRYLFAALPLLAMVAALKPWAIRFYAPVSMLLLANVAWGYFVLDQSTEFEAAQLAGAVAVISTFSVLLLVGSLVAAMQLLHGLRGLRAPDPRQTSARAPAPEMKV